MRAHTREKRPWEVRAWRTCPTPTFCAANSPARWRRTRKRSRTIFGLPENADIVFRPFDAGGFSLCAVYTEGMAQSDKVADFILRACHAFDAGAEPSRRKRGPNTCSKTPSASRRRGWKSASRSWSARYWAA